MRILSIDTSAPDYGSWALMDDKKILRAETFAGRASSELFPSLEAYRTEWNGIAKILVGVGPGSFSGIRVAVAAAQGLALSQNCPVIGVRSADAVAKKFSHVSYLGVFAQARSQEYFGTFYSRGKLVEAPQVFLADDLENQLSKCTYTVSADDVPGVALRAVPMASDLALSYLANGEELALEPIYIGNANSPSCRAES